MIGKKNKYIIVDRELELGFITGDLKVVGAIIGVSHKKVIHWFTGTQYRDQGRFIISKNPYEIKRRQGGKVSPQFLKHRFVKKK